MDNQNGRILDNSDHTVDNSLYDSGNHVYHLL
jgi:hypothetical protein